MNSNCNKNVKQLKFAFSYRALTRYMTPPCTSVLPPVENSSQGFVTSVFDLTRIQRLIEIEEEHVTTLLAVAAISAPILLGRKGIKPSKSTGMYRYI